MKIWRVRSKLYQWARILGDLDAFLALFKGDIRKPLNRIKNKFLGRAMGRSGVWRKWF